MIKQKIYSYDLAREKGYTLEGFFQGFLPKPTKSVDLTKIIFENDAKIISKIESFRGEQIVIIGDYDVDGITSSAILHQTLERLGFMVKTILPNRFKDGYGLSKTLVDKAREIDAKLIITVDNGINATEGLLHAKNNGIDVIITDHHLPNDDNWTKYNPYTMNPHCNKNNLVNKEICGAGVSLILATKLIQELSPEMLDSRFYKGLIELASIGTIADVVPIKDENQAILTMATSEWKKGNCINEGLKTLINSMGKFQIEELDQENISFYLAPCLNASGRLDDAKCSFDLLMCEKNYLHMAKLATKIIGFNARRQEITTLCTNYILKQFDNNFSIQVLQIPKGFENIKERELEGIIGLVAQKCTEAFKMPSLIFAGDKFSGRSTIDVNLHKLLSSLEVPSLSFGGHSGACGGKIDYNCDRITLLIEATKKIKNATTDIEKKYIKLPNDVTPLEVYNAFESVKPYDVGVFPAVAITKIDARNLTPLGTKHCYFYSSLCEANKDVKFILFNKLINPESSFKFDIKYATVKPTKGYGKDIDYIVDEIVLA